MGVNNDPLYDTIYATYSETPSLRKLSLVKENPAFKPDERRQLISSFTYLYLGEIPNRPGECAIICLDNMKIVRCSIDRIIEVGEDEDA